MTIRANLDADPSDLADVLQAVQDFFADAGETATFRVGKSFAEASVGSPPFVLFVPEREGEMGPPIQSGRAASVKEACQVHIRGAEDGSDIGRYRSASAIRRRVVTAIGRAARGGLEWGKYEPSSPLDVDSGAGAEVSFVFTWHHDIRHDESIMGVKPAPRDTTPARPQVPPGQPAASLSVSPLTTTPQE